MDSSTLTRAAGLVAAAIVGGGAALGGAALFGGVGSRTTTVREVLSPGYRSAPASSFKPSGQRLSINAIFRRSAPGVVQVTTTSVVKVREDPFFGNPFGPQTETQHALGSGFVLDKLGHVITNYHVIEGARPGSVEVSFSNNDSLPAKIVGSDPSTDIAVLKVDAHARALTPLTLGNSDTVRVGDSVVAIGNPFGLDRTVTAGIVSAIQRPITAPNRYTIDHAIQTDAALNHGNSGGPLLNAQGEVIGVNSQIATGGTSEGNVGIGFAIPINTVRNVAAQIIKTGHVEHAFIGISPKPITPEIAALFHLPAKHGLLIESVEPGSGADRAGLRGGKTQVVVDGVTWTLGGDLLVRVDGVRVGSLDRLRDLVNAKRPGDTMQLVIYRGNDRQTVEVKLGRLPTSPQS